MATLLLRHGYGIKHVNESLNEQVPIACRKNNEHYVSFGGFIERPENILWSKFSQVRKVKINNVYGFSKTDGYFDVVHFGLNVVGLGYYSLVENAVRVPLFDGLPLVWCEVREWGERYKPTEHSKVVNLFTKTGQNL